MIVIVGHGLSLVRAKLGHWLDTQTLVRLKDAPRGDPQVWGTRTDYICSRKKTWVMQHPPCREIWMFMPGEDNGDRRFADYARWTTWYAGFSSMKPSHGLCAAMCAVEFLNPPEIGVIGFDSMMHPEETEQGKYNRPPGKWCHDQHAEAKALHALGPRIIDLATHLG